jgi:hypothetical protein
MFAIFAIFAIFAKFAIFDPALEYSTRIHRQALLFPTHVRTRLLDTIEPPVR